MIEWLCVSFISSEDECHLMLRAIAVCVAKLCFLDGFDGDHPLLLAPAVRLHPLLDASVLAAPDVLIALFSVFILSSNTPGW